MRGFADPDGDDAVVIGQAVQIVRDAQHSAVVLHVAAEGFSNRTLIQGVPENTAQPFACFEGLGRGISVGHERHYARFGRPAPSEFLRRTPEALRMQRKPRT
jgi:hypothetical protein